MREDPPADTIRAVEHSLFGALPDETLALDEVLGKVLPVDFTKLFSSNRHIELRLLAVDVVDFSRLDVYRSTAAAGW